MRPWIPLGLLLIAPAVLAATPEPATPGPALEAAVSGKTRTATNAARDKYRHPAEELAFFGVKPNSSVIEIWPGGGYWTEILAPYLRADGTYTLAVAGGSESGAAKLHAKLEADPAVYDKVKFTEFGPGTYALAPANSADFVLTFRNLHNWMDEGTTSQALAAMYSALKPGGILGIEDHRAAADAPEDPKAENGYVKQADAIAAAKHAGFEFVGSSEIDANPRDTKDYPKGVWTLPPTYALKDVDHAKYEAIGEADNFVIKFRKPER